MKAKIGSNQVGFFEIGKLKDKKKKKMEIKTKLDGEKVFIFSKDQDCAKSVFESSLMLGNTTLENLIKAAVSAHAELLKEKARAWDTVTEMIKEMYPLEDGAELEYNHISGEFRVIKNKED
jgi:hypothetical protein